MRPLTLFMALCSTTALAGPSPELDLGHTFDATLGVDAKPAQKALGCTGAWEESPGKTPTGESYLVSKCGSSDAQVYLSSGKVFAVGTKLESGLDNRKASAVFKEMKKGLLAAKCKVEDRGQLLVGRCDGKAAILLLNWDSKSDSMNISLLYGVADQLLPMIGAH